jgi:hypothetical protein
MLGQGAPQLVQSLALLPLRIPIRRPAGVTIEVGEWKEGEEGEEGAEVRQEEARMNRKMEMGAGEVEVEVKEEEEDEDEVVFVSFMGPLEDASKEPVVDFSTLEERLIEKATCFGSSEKGGEALIVRSLLSFDKQRLLHCCDV